MSDEENASEPELDKLLELPKLVEKKFNALEKKIEAGKSKDNTREIKVLTESIGTLAKKIELLEEKPSPSQKCKSAWLPMIILLILSISLGAGGVLTNIWQVRAENDLRFAERPSKSLITSEKCKSIGFETWEQSDNTSFCGKFIHLGKQ